MHLVGRWDELDLMDFTNAMIDFSESRGKVMAFTYSTEQMIFKLDCLWYWEYGDSGSGHFDEKIHYGQGYDIKINESEVESINLMSDEVIEIICDGGGSYIIKMGAAGAGTFIWTLGFGGR